MFDGGVALPCIDTDSEVTWLGPLAAGRRSAFLGRLSSVCPNHISLRTPALAFHDSVTPLRVRGREGALATNPPYSPTMVSI